MPRPFEVAVGWWKRFSRYEIRDGYILPARGAKLSRYDPWADYRVARSGTKEQQPPYQILLELLEDLRFRPASGGALALTPEAEARLLAWCARNGLLGILPHRTLMVVFPPQWEPEMEGNRKGLLPSLRTYARTNTGWFLRISQQLVGGAEWRGAAHEKGQPIPEEYWPKQWPKPGVLIGELHKGGWKWESVTETWARFFPDIPRGELTGYPYPLPLTEDFWRIYAEPLDAFVSGAAALRDALKDLTATEAKSPGVEHGRRILHALLGPVSPALDIVDGGQFRQRWVATSLLASYSMMAFQDLVEQRQVLICRICGKLFISGAWQATYCSPRCRHTAQKRAYRDKKRRKRGKAAEGRSIAKKGGLQ